MATTQTPMETAMAIMRLAKLPPGYEPVILPSGFIDAVREYFETHGKMPVEQGTFKGGYSERGYACQVAYGKLARKLGDMDLLRCLAPSEWARTKSHQEELLEIIRGGDREEASTGAE